MLDAMRRGAGSWIVKIFLGVLVLSFAAWGIGDIFRIQPDSTVIEIGDSQVSGNTFLQTYNNRVRGYQQRFGTTITPDLAQQLGITNQVIQELVDSNLYHAAVSELGLTASDQTIRDHIAQDPNFRDQLGQFDRFRFEALLSQSGYSEASYVAARREDLARLQLMQSVNENITAPVTLTEALFAREGERRTARYVAIPTKDLTDLPAATDDALAQYHQEHKDDFMAPEYRQLTYILLQDTDLFDQIEVSDVDIIAAFEDQKASFSTQETRAVQQLVLDDEETAQSVYERLNNGEDFTTVGQEATGDDTADFDLGIISRSDLLDNLADAAFALAEEEISVPIESPIGWHILKVDAINAGKEATLADVRDEITTNLKTERAVDLLYQTSQDIEDAFAGGADIAEVAETFNLPLQKIDAIDASGNNRQGSPAVSLPDVPEFLRTAFNTDEGVEPALTESDNGAYFSIRLDGITPAALRPLEEVLNEVRNAYDRGRRQEAANESGTALVEEIKGGKGLQEIADQFSVVVESQEKALRRDIIASNIMTPELVATLFDTPAKEAISGVSEGNDTFIIAITDDIYPADAGQDGTIEEQLQQAVQQAVAQDIASLLTLSLHDKFQPTVNEDVIEALFAATQ